MKQRTLKVLLWIAIVWIVLVFILISYILGKFAGVWEMNQSLQGLALPEINLKALAVIWFVVYNIPAWILLIIVGVKWGNRER